MKIADLYQSVTADIIKDLEAGTAPWTKPWKNGNTGGILPMNAATKRGYNGINIPILWHAQITHGYKTASWMTCAPNSDACLSFFSVATALDQTATVTAYKQLSTAERAFRSLKTVDLEVRPIYHRRADRVRAHVFLCMLAYYVEWHMRQKLKPILFDDHDKAAADAARPSVVAKAERSEAAQRKARNRCTDDGLPVHSFRSLLADLATVTRNVMAINGAPEASFVLYPQLTPVQDRAFQLLDLVVKV